MARKHGGGEDRVRREERLAAALRENLHRRKAAARAATSRDGEAEISVDPAMPGQGESPGPALRDGDIAPPTDPAMSAEPESSERTARDD